MIYRVVDFESSGPEGESEVIEVGWCDVDRGAVCMPDSLLLKHEKPIDVETMAIHHLQESDFGSAVSQEAGFRYLRKREDVGEGVIYVAHGAKFEKASWPDAPGNWICTYKCALRLFPDSPRHSLQVLRYYLGLFDLPPTLAMPVHRAGPDAFVTAHVLVKMLEVATPQQLREWSDQPAILPKITFSKNRGTKWTEINDGFLYWVLERDFDEDVMHTARTELDRRTALRNAEEEAFEREGNLF